MLKGDGRSFWKHLSAKYGSHRVIYLKVDSQIAQKKSDCRYLLITGKRDDVLQREAFIAAEMIHNLHLMNKVDGMSVWKHARATHGSDSAISANVDTQIAHKMLDLGYPLSMENGVLCCKERHLLLMKWSMSFLWCIREMGGAFESICQLSMGHTMWYIWRLTLKLHRKGQILGTFSALESWMMCYNERHSLLLKWFTIFFWWIK